jgi:probable HAF family extracellular repeat protein
MRTLTTCMVAALLAASAATGAFAAEAPRYAVTDLGDLGGSAVGTRQSFGGDINDHGWVTGIADTDVGRRAFVWTSQGGMQDIGSLGGGGLESIGVHINNQGQVAGWSMTGAGYDTHAYVWSAGDGMQDLGKGAAWALNNHGAVVTGGQLLRPGEAAQALPSGFSGYTLNDKEQMAGIMSVGTGTHVALLDHGQLKDLGALPSSSEWAYAHELNERGDVAGVSIVSPGVEHAVVWRNGGAAIDLGDFAGGYDGSRALGINDAGFVVGYGTTDGPGLGWVRAAIWNPEGVMTNLNDQIPSASGWALAQATAINENGQIVGWGINSLGQTHAFLLTPVPEPQTSALYMVGLLATACGVRRSSRRVSRALP